jgi:U3 small nucleolar RNA-associated protein 23
MADHEKEREKVKAAGGRPRPRPEWLPPPTEVPLRHCKHKSNEGEDLGVLGEARCLVDLLAGQPHGNELAKNKQHFILATADADEKEQRRKGFVDVRERARMIPGVPVVYVKRSVMILEELSGASERVRRGTEREKFREGLVGIGRKRKRDDGEEGSEDEDDLDITEAGAKMRGTRGVKGPNPLSVKKKKKQTNTTQNGVVEASAVPGEESQAKRKRRRKRGVKKHGDEGEALTELPAADAEA